MTLRQHDARLMTNGTLDTSFDPGSEPEYGPSAFAFQPDEMIVICGAFTHYDGTGRNRLARIFGAISTSSPETATAAALRAWPNPASSVLNLSGRVDGLVLDATGRPVRTVKQSATVPLKELASGVYTLRTSDGRSIRFVKE